MPIVAVCGQCSKRYTLDDKFAGRKVKCRTCNSQFVVPAEDPTLVSAPEPPAPPSPTATMGEDVLEMKTEFLQRGSMPTVTEERADPGDAMDDSEATTATRSLKRDRGGKGTERRKSRYKRKSRWLLKSVVGLVVLLGIAIGVGSFVVPKNMAFKWDRTKQFWGTEFLGYLGDMVSIDMALEKAADSPADEDTAAPVGPQAGTRVTLRGRITAVQPGVAGGDPTNCTVTVAEGAEYRLMLPAKSARLAEIAATLKDGGEGPVVEVQGVLAENGLDGNKPTQVDAEALTEVEAEAIAGKVGLEVEGGDAGDAGDAPPSDAPADPPAEDSGDDGDAADDG